MARAAPDFFKIFRLLAPQISKIRSPTGAPGNDWPSLGSQLSNTWKNTCFLISSLILGSSTGRILSILIRAAGPSAQRASAGPAGRIFPTQNLATVWISPRDRARSIGNPNLVRRKKQNVELPTTPPATPRHAAPCPRTCRRSTSRCTVVQLAAAVWRSDQAGPATGQGLPRSQPGGVRLPRPPRPPPLHPPHTDIPRAGCPCGAGAMRHHTQLPQLSSRYPFCLLQLSSSSAPAQLQLSS